MNWLCYLGLHSWGGWMPEYFATKPRKRLYRQCRRCGRREWQ